MSKVAVVILNWNGCSFLEQFLPGVISNSPNADVIVADNASTDHSLQVLSSKFPSVRVLNNSKNEGFAGGYNTALEQIKGEYTYYAILNSDVEVDSNWLDVMVTLMNSNSKIAGVQPKILSQHQKTHFEYAGAAGGFIDKNYYPFCRGRIFSTLEEDKGQHDYPLEVFWTSGAAMLVRADVFHELNGFDSYFFAHMEEIDFCFRAKLLGYKFMIEPKSTVYHVGGGTLNYQSPRKTFLNFRNSLFMIYKNHPGWVGGKIFTRLCLDGIAGIQFLVKLQPKHTAAIIKAHIAYYGALASLRKKRKEIQSSKTDFNQKGIFNGSILFNYFIKGVKTFDQLNGRLFR
jgi:GT2 family glycosyltransferase